jgi:hypothetical protein
MRATTEIADILGHAEKLIENNSIEEQLVESGALVKIQKQDEEVAK